MPVAAWIPTRGSLSLTETTMMNFLKSLLFGSGHDLGPDDAATAIQSGAPVIDVREPQEFATGAIAGAINVPLGQIQRQGLAALHGAGVDIDAPTLLLVCRSGARSGSACLALRGALGERAKNVAGGVMAWESRGLPLTPGGR